MGAIGDVVVGQAVEAELARNQAARDGLRAAVNEVGLRSVTALSSTTLENDRDSAEFDNFRVENNVLVAGSTILGIGTIAKLLRRSGDIVPGGGINPNAGNGDAPDADGPDSVPLREPEADFAGRGTVRPDLIDHLEIPTRSGRQISGGHNADNFYAVLQQEGGTVVSSRQEVPGITIVQYRLPGANPNRLPETKTVYDPAIFPNVPALAQDAAVRALRQYTGTGASSQIVTVGGVRFQAQVSVRNGVPTVNTVYPIGRGQ